MARGLEAPEERFALTQGRFLGRPSRLDVRVDADGHVRVGGGVQLLAQARLLPPPESLG